jgi:hypothetical protein
VLDRILQLCGLSLTHLELLVPLVQLGLEVVDIALGSGQLILSVLQSGAGIIKEVGFEVMVAISPNQLIVQLLDTRLKASVLLKKLSVALLNVRDGAILGLHLVGILLQAEALVGASCHDLLKQGAHVLDVRCRERPTRVVGRKLGIAMTATRSLHTALPSFRIGSKAMVVPLRTTRWRSQNCHEGLVGSPL